MDTLSPEQKELSSAIMGSGKASSPNLKAEPTTSTLQGVITPAENPNRILSQAEIDALFASMT